MARKLRIAASVFFGVLSLALCVLWVRSYTINESISRVVFDPATPALGYSHFVVTAVGWSKGRIYAAELPYFGAATGIQKHGWIYNVAPLSAQDWVLLEADPGRHAYGKSWLPPPYVRGLPRGFSLSTEGICVRIEALVSVTMIATALPWRIEILSGIKSSPRYSLRTLLIATTLVAAILSLGVWLVS